MDLSCGANDFSILMKKRLEEAGKKCSYRKYDLLPTKNEFSSERSDWMTVQQTELPSGSQLIIGLTPPPLGHKALANKFIDKALEFKPKLLILIVDPEIERLNKKLSLYDLIWEDENFPSDTSIYVPGSVHANDRQIDKKNVRPPRLSLWSRSDWTTKHRVIAQDYDHVCNEHDTLAAAVHATSGTYADNSKLTHDEEDQASVSGNVQKRSLSYNVDECWKGMPGKSRRKRKHIEENISAVAVIPPAKRHAVNKICNGVADDTQPIPLNTSSLGSEPRTFSKSVSFGYGGGLHGFAAAPNYEYASKHSCGWLEE